MTDRSRDQYRDGHRKTNHGLSARWTGQLYAVITKQDGTTSLVGQWWDEEPANHWAQVYMKRYPGTTIQILELEFKDFYIPHRSLANTRDVNIKGDIL